MVNLEQIGIKRFSTVFICIGLAERNSQNRGKSNVQKYIYFSNSKSSSFTEAAKQQEGVSLHLWVRVYITFDSFTPKICNKMFHN